MWNVRLAIKNLIAQIKVYAIQLVTQILKKMVAQNVYTLLQLLATFA